MKGQSSPRIRGNHEVTKYLRTLERRGYDISHEGPHWKIRRDGRLITTASATPGGGNRSMENLKAHIRRFERENGIIIH
jgi:hypothetical protein